MYKPVTLRLESQPVSDKTLHGCGAGSWMHSGIKRMSDDDVQAAYKLSASEPDDALDGRSSSYVDQWLLSPQIWSRNRAHVPPTFGFKSPSLFRTLFTPRFLLYLSLFFPFLSTLFPMLHPPFFSRSLFFSRCPEKIGGVLINIFNKTVLLFFCWAHLRPLGIEMEGSLASTFERPTASELTEQASSGVSAAAGLKAYTAT